MTMLTIIISRGLARLLKLFNRGGSLPGKVALKLNHNILKKLKYECKIIVVTGTNGKTSTANYLGELFNHNNDKLIQNRKGDNLKAGITTTIVTNTRLSKKVNASIIVLEVDELNIPFVINNLNVDYLIVTNFFRDQLDRANEMEQLISKIEKGIVNFKGQLVLNGNDPNVVRLYKSSFHQSPFFYGLAKYEESTTTTNEANEGKFCPICHSKLNYMYYHYSHIGSFSCSKCSFKTPDLNVTGLISDLNTYRFTVDDNTYQAPQAGVYSVYNALALISIAKIFNIKSSIISKTFIQAVLPKGRNETFRINERDCVINLIKNPTGANEVLKVITKDHKSKCICIILNDNIQDGCDVSWIYDTNFEHLNTANCERIIVSGTRGYEIALRLQYGGYKGEIVVESSIEQAIKTMSTNMVDSYYVLSTYTALYEAHECIKKVSV